MSGKPGTVRFGMNPDEHGKTNSSGVSKVSLPKSGGEWTEVHFAYNPAQKSRSMGTTRGGDPGQEFTEDDREPDYMCNHDGYAGGSTVVINLDERKVLQNTIYAVECEYTDTSPNGKAPSSTTGAFD